MNNLLKIDGLTKKYYNKVALDDITLTFNSGKIYGLLGPNGSGKTTLMKVVAGLHKQTKGSILINGEPISYKTKGIVAYMPTENFLIDNFKIKQVLKFYKDMYKDFDEEKAIKLLSTLKVNINTTVKSLSSGLVAKLKLALTLSRDASVYMFDEPLNGIDILAREDIINCIVNSCGEDKIIIVSSHIVDEIEKLFDDVVFIKEQKVALEGNAEQLRIEHGKSIENIYKEIYG
ncbi:ABC transporter ATP-binding protein [Sedimentibacter sp. zth1]|uniref:ABC transporter ATP-binding protein n=1 Tax=Sedimentibacter sp. zth1 TaxID=2816908 RepID=UPI001A937B8B|nr:ABC transporter ATP-binding protein [Sedimentibacter sp. zth1]QSX05525.1 ABC transporter ATP-binding protein [Sedimentibacter sp. zth1]